MRVYVNGGWDAPRAFAAAAAAGGGYAAEALVAILAERDVALSDALDAAERRAVARHHAEAAARASGDDDGQRGPGPLAFDRLTIGGHLVAAAYGGGRSRAVILSVRGWEWEVGVEADDHNGPGPWGMAQKRAAAAEAILGPETRDGGPSPFAGRRWRRPPTRRPRHAVGQEPRTSTAPLGARCADRQGNPARAARVGTGGKTTEAQMHTDPWLVTARAEAERRRRLQPAPYRRLWREVALAWIARAVLVVALAVFGGWAVIVIADAMHDWLCAEDFQP